MAEIEKSTVIASGSTNYIQNTETLQSGSTFYISSGTVTGQLKVGSLGHDVGINFAIYIGTTGILSLSLSEIVPNEDNRFKLGSTNFRFTEVWAVNGSIQTSTLKNKRDVVDISTTSLIVPRGITFKWKSKEGGNEDYTYIGFEADSLPTEAHARKNDGTVDPDNIYTSSVIGILCAKVRDLEERLSKLEKK